MQQILPRVSFERPVILLPVALLLIAAAGGIIWTGTTTHSRTQPSLATSRAFNVTRTATLVSVGGISRGQVIRSRDLAIKALSPSDAPVASLHHLEEAEGHLALTMIPAGKPVLKREISPEIATGIAPLVPQGYRAYAISVSEADIAGGFLQARNEVDLYVTLPSALFADRSNQNQGDHSKAMLLLQDVRVLAVGSRLVPGGQADPSVRTVTLALSASDLAKVALAARLGRISFAIRNPVDNEIAAGQYAQITTLLDGEKREEHPHRAAAGVPYLAGRSRSILQLPGSR
jgi:pilus assembly protein CpaB